MALLKSTFSETTALAQCIALFYSSLQSSELIFFAPVAKEIYALSSADASNVCLNATNNEISLFLASITNLRLK